MIKDVIYTIKSKPVKLKESNKKNPKYKATIECTVKELTCDEASNLMVEISSAVMRIIKAREQKDGEKNG